MQMKLLAAAVAGGLAVPAISVAQSTVQLYGNAMWQYGVIDQGPGRPNADYNEVSGSYIGFRGTEALGGGITAWFQCETTMDIRAFDQTGLCSRNSGLGFRGGFGNVWGGRWHTPMSRIFSTVSGIGAEATGLLGTSYINGGSGSSSLAEAAFAGPGETQSGGANRHRFRRRETCLTTYETPNMSGFMVGAAVSCGNAAAEGGATSDGNNTKPRLYSVAGSYTNGPLLVGLGYQQHDNVGAFNSATKNLTDKHYGVVAAYTFGPVRVGLTYAKREWETLTGDIDKQTATIGVQWTISGPHQLHVFYGDTGDSKGDSRTGINATTQGGAEAPRNAAGNKVKDTGYQIGSIAYQYNFSKRTLVKIGYIRAMNDDNSRSIRAQGGASLTADMAGETTDGYSLLFKHRF